MYTNPITKRRHRSWCILHREIGKGLSDPRIGNFGEIVGWGHAGNDNWVPAWQIIKLFDRALEEEYVDLDRRGRGTTLNHDLYAYEPSQGVAVIQARQYHKRSASHFGATRKTYFLVGCNEITGAYFRHPVGSQAVRSACRKSAHPTRADVVQAVQRWMWGVSTK